MKIKKNMGMLSMPATHDKIRSRIMKEVTSGKLCMIKKTSSLELETFRTLKVCGVIQVVSESNNYLIIESVVQWLPSPRIKSRQ